MHVFRRRRPVCLSVPESMSITLSPAFCLCMHSDRAVVTHVDADVLTHTLLPSLIMHP